jgi:pimeloyl-ACP methyl ester carboxylesterase
VITLLLAGLGLTAVTVIGHGLGAMAAALRAARIWNERKDRLGRLGAELLVVRLVSALLLMHVAEAGIWALFFAVVGAAPDLESAAYFSLTSYSTIGYGDIVLPERWRLLGPIEGTVGVLMLGWSTGILVAMIGRMYGVLFQVVPPRESAKRIGSCPTRPEDRRAWD